MNNNISPMNNVSFQAKLDISKVKGSKQRWQNIARLFEEKTKILYQCCDSVHGIWFTCRNWRLRWQR